MILSSQPRWQTETWQQQLSGAVRDPAVLMQLLALDPAESPISEEAMRQFPLRAPLAFVERMQPGNWQDPLLLQILPSRRELLDQPGFCADPLEELAANPAPGLIHKYRGRVLLIASPACAVHCRYCFRRHFPYSDNTPGRRAWQAALDYIAADSSISEVILSGGDPLAASDSYLAELTNAIAAIPHVSRLRLHTRLPVVIPARVTDDFIKWLTGSRLQAVVVIHSNHPQELDDVVAEAVKRLTANGVTVLNQSVLLQGVNDRGEILVKLSLRLFEIGVLPYYLHVLDKVAGAAHFDVDEPNALALQQTLLAELPGYLVPKLVREEAAALSKTPL